MLHRSSCYCCSITSVSFIFQRLNINESNLLNFGQGYNAKDITLCAVACNADISRRCFLFVDIGVGCSLLTLNVYADGSS